jgi:hypothetical protein
MITLDGSLKVNSVISSFMKREHPRWMKEVWFTLDESSTMNIVNKSVTASSSVVNKGSFSCLLSGFLLCYSV